MSARKQPRRISRGSVLVLTIAALVLAILFLGWAKCGLGREEGSSGEDESKAPEVQTATADARPPVCLLRVDSDGTVRVGERTLTVAEAVAHCQGAEEVALDVAGDVPFGVVQDLRSALEGAGLRVRDTR